MSSVEYLREFVNKRLTAAAQEIFGVLKKTIVEYEEEIDRQRRLLDNLRKPEIKLHRIELPQQHVCTEEEVVADQQLCIQERNSSLDQEDPEPPQIKEEQEELCTSQEGEQLVLKQETDAFMLTPTDEESDHSEPEPNRDKRLLSHNSHAAESQDQKGGKHGDSGSTRDAEPNNQHHKSKTLTDNVYNSALSKIHHITHTGKSFFQCDTCGKDFKYQSQLNIHLRIHTGEKPYSCSSCGKRFNQTSGLNTHLKIHTGEKPFTCKTCGKRFSQTSNLNTHIRIHTGEKPFSCKTCGEEFRFSCLLKVHMRRAHTGEKPYLCKICGKRYFCASHLAQHKRLHTGK
ncbi:zinc finger protein 239-like [Siniperca chuatsi]|uniref:zinc finger protein 239-like n=1 Tax=Siniperca chuatsi TaxID=119488 RepID=UPI001CE1F130|nr:zinc finger protein 239-like [Siniperca chuatsi]